MLCKYNNYILFLLEVTLFPSSCFSHNPEGTQNMSVKDRMNSAFADSAETFGLVGLAWRVRVGKEVYSGEYGTHSREDPTPLSPTQQWHWGSCAKALTSTVVGCLIDSGLLSKGWETTVGEVIPDLAESKIGAVTLLHLAHHRSGLLEDLEKEEEEKLHISVASLPLPQQRLVYVKHLAQKDLHHPPGEKYGPYSNAGFVVIAALAETAASTPWEELVDKYVVKPLNMTSFGFGIPSGAIGHDEDDTPQPNGKDKPWLNSSFSVHSTLEDWEKFASVHKDVLRGEYKEGVLVATPSTMRKIQTPASPATPREAWDGNEPPNGYAMGWKTIWEDTEEEQELPLHPSCLWHFGTNFMWNAGIYVDKEKDIVAVLGSNAGSMLARLAMRTALESMIAIASESEPTTV